MTGSITILGYGLATLGPGLGIGILPSGAASALPDGVVTRPLALARIWLSKVSGRSPA